MSFNLNEEFVIWSSFGRLLRLERSGWWLQVFTAAAAIIFVFFKLRMRKKIRAFPPGPLAWPIVGCLPVVGFHGRHKTYFNLSKKYGPIMHIQLGGEHMILIHSPEIAKEALRTQDLQFCSRPLDTGGKYLAFGYQDIVFSPYNAHWKLLRRVFNTELMSTARLNMQAEMRKGKMMAMADRVLAHIERGEMVNVKKIANDVVLNILVQMLFGKRYENSDSSISKELKNFEPYVREAVVLVGELNIGEFVPFLARFDLQGVERRYQKLMEKVGKLFQLIIDDHKHALDLQKDSQVSEESKDVIDVLLSQKGENKLTTKQIMGVMTDILLVGLDTTTTTIEWAMAEMVANPHTLHKAQHELDTIVGRNRLFEESDIEKLPYLQAVVKEALRLHPPVPVGLPHLNEASANLAGYSLPPNCMVFVCIWAIGRDPSVWEEPLQFKPERFMGSEVNVHGNHYQLLPFSSGRRKCPAYQMATVRIQHVLGMLLQCFEWRPPAGVRAEEMDLSEAEAGGVLSLKNPLLLSARPRLDVSLYTSV